MTRIRIEPGSIADHRALAAHHYRRGRPATIERVLVSRAAGFDEPVGVLVVSRPTLNARWRALAWPGRYDGPDRRVAAARLNAELRCISRVIVHPDWRRRGIARRLVLAYLKDPLTRRTEVYVSRGRSAGFFAQAGMKPVPLTPSRRDARLLDCFAHLRSGPGPGSRLHGLLERELRLWARASRATRRILDVPRTRPRVSASHHALRGHRPEDGSVARLFHFARDALARAPVAYVTEQGSGTRDRAPAGIALTGA